MNCPLLNSAHRNMMMIIIALEGILIHGFGLCMRDSFNRYSSFISLNSKILIIKNGRTSEGIPSPLKSGPWFVTMLVMIVNASVMEFARKNIQANEMKENVKMILMNLGAKVFLLVSFE